MIRIVKSVRSASVLSVIAVVLGACSEDSKGPAEPVIEDASFQATVSGALQGSVDGIAAFGQSSEGGEQVFGIGLVPEDEDGLIAIYRNNAERPGKGTYQIGTGKEFEAGVVMLSEDELAGAFEAVSGSLNITTSSNDVVKGTFNFTARGVLMEDPEEELEIIVSGSFTATRGTTTLSVSRVSAAVSR